MSSTGASTRIAPASAQVTAGHVSRLRRVAVSLIHCKAGRKVAEALRRLNRNVRAIFDHLQMSKNALRSAAAARPTRRATAPA